MSDTKKQKNDEFYTTYGEVDLEVSKHSEAFKGKSVFCNCDNPYSSQIVKYFDENFEDLELKNLTALGIDLKRELAFSMVRNDKNFNVESIPFERGNFKSVFSRIKLSDCDIVVSNPPFSLFREYMEELFRSGKKFLVMGNKTAATYKEIFPYIRDNKLWLGYRTGEMEFRVPKSMAGEKNVEYRDGKYYQKLRNMCWFTNIDYPERHNPLELLKEYNENDYQVYDNYNAINCNKLADIPKDYNGIMGVPLSYLQAHSPEQFKIVDFCRNLTIEEKTINPRILIQKL